MKNLLFVAKSLGASGNPLYWGPIFKSINMSGLSVTVLTGNKLNKPSDKIDYLSYNYSVRVLIKEFIRIWQKKQDLIVFVVEFSKFSFISILISKVLKLRCVILVENDPRYLKGYGINRGGLFNIWRKLLCALCDKILVNNEECKSYLVRDIGVGTNKITVSPYLTSQFSIKKFKEKNADIIKYVSCGQLIERKGFVEFVRQVSKLPVEILNRSEFYIYGDGKEKENIQKEIVSCGLENKIYLRGYVAYAELPNELGRYDCFIIPTKADYRSLVAFEAISLGMPLIISKRDGSATETVLNDFNGFIYDPLADGELTKALEKFVDIDTNIDKFGEMSKVMAEKFTVNKIVSSYISIVESIN